MPHGNTHPAFPSRQLAPVAPIGRHGAATISGLHNRFGKHGNIPAPVKGARLGGTGHGSFAPPHHGGFAPVGKPSSQTNSPTGRLDNKMGKRNTPTYRGGFAPVGSGGATQMQGPDTSIHKQGMVLDIQKQRPANSNRNHGTSQATAITKS